MSVKEVLKQVAMFLQLNNLIDANLDDFENLDDQTKRDANILVSSVNEVLCDISTEYMPLVATESITVLDGSFDVENLSKDFYKVAKFGNNDSYKINLNNILAKDGIYDLTYSYLPEVVGLDDKIVFDKRLTKFALSYGVAKEYCLICGNYAEAEMWESKFKNAMLGTTKSAGVASLKHRRWI